MYTGCFSQFSSLPCPPWHDLPGICYCRCNISEAESMDLRLKNQVWAKGATSQENNPDLQNYEIYI